MSTHLVSDDSIRRAIEASKEVGVEDASSITTEILDCLYAEDRIAESEVELAHHTIETRVRELMS